MTTAITKRNQTTPAHVLADRVVQRLTEAEKALSVAVGIDAPAAAGVYMLRHGDDVLYVGESINMRKRWAVHELRPCLDVPGVTLSCVACGNRKNIEADLIRQLRPRFNGRSWTEAYFWRRGALGIPATPDDLLTAQLREAVEVMRQIALGSDGDERG